MSERESQQGYLNGFLAGALIGGAIGAITALIFAPKSGRELRRDIADRSLELYDKAQEFIGKSEDAENVPSTASYAMNDGRVRADRIVQTARDHAQSLMADAEHVLREARAKAASVKDSVEHGVQRVQDSAKAGVDAFESEWNSSSHQEG